MTSPDQPSSLPGSPLEVADAPGVAGLVFRRFRGAADFPVIAHLIHVSVAADGGIYSPSPDQVANTYGHLTNCDPYEDMLFAEVGGVPVGYGRAWWQQHIDGEYHYIHLCQIAPEWRDLGIGTAMLHYLQQRLRTYAEGFAGAGPQLFTAWADDGQEQTRALLLADGYAVTRWAYGMRRPLTEPLPPVELPEGLEVRPVEPEHHRAIWEADREAFRDHHGYAEATESDYQEWLNDPLMFTPALWQVAWDTATNAVAGQVRSFINQAENERLQRRRGYTEYISVRRPWRRQGLARALLVRSMQLLKDVGMDEAALGVDALNPNGALRLYESVGFTVEMRSSTFEKPVFG